MNVYKVMTGLSIMGAALHVQALEATRKAENATGDWNLTSEHWTTNGISTAWINDGSNTAVFAASGTVTVSEPGILIGPGNAGIKVTGSGTDVTITGQPLTNNLAGGVDVRADIAAGANLTLESNTIVTEKPFRKMGAGTLLIKGVQDLFMSTFVPSEGKTILDPTAVFRAGQTLHMGEQSSVLDLGGTTQTITNFGWYCESATAPNILSNGTIRAYSWASDSNNKLKIAKDASLYVNNYPVLQASQVITLDTGAGVFSLGTSPAAGSIGFIMGVDNNSGAEIRVKDGTFKCVDHTGATPAQKTGGLLRLACGGGTSRVQPFANLFVEGGLADIGWNLGISTWYQDPRAQAFHRGIGTLSISGGAVKLGTDDAVVPTGGNIQGLHGYLYMGGTRALTFSDAKVEMTGGELWLDSLQANAFGRSRVSINGGTIKAQSAHANFIAGESLSKVELGASGATIDTAYAVTTRTPFVQSAAGGKLVKKGAGTLTALGGHILSGTNQVQGGTLKITGGTRKDYGLRLHLDASELSTITTNASGALTAWVDKSGAVGAVGPYQNNATRAPKYVSSSSFGGRNVMRFDGSDDVLDVNLNINPNVMPDCTIIAVYRMTAYSNNQSLFGSDDGGWDRLQLLYWTGGSANAYDFASGGANYHVNGLDTLNPLVYVATHRANASSYVHLNGMCASAVGYPGVNGGTGTGNTRFGIGAITYSGNYYGFIELAEFMVFDKPLSREYREKVERDLRVKWGVSVDTLVHIDASATNTLTLADMGSYTNVIAVTNMAGWYVIAPSNNPSFASSVPELNSKPAIEFNGSNSYLTVNLDISSEVMPEMTLLMVYRPLSISPTADKCLWGHDNGGWDRHQMLTSANLSYGNVAAFNGGIRVENLQVPSKPVVYSAVFRAGLSEGSRVYVDGAPACVAFNNVEVSAAESSLTIGAKQVNGASASHIQLAEFKLYARALSDTERETEELKLQEKWIKPASSVLPVVRLDASVLTETNNAFVTSFTDQSGNNTHAAQADTTKAPRFVISEPLFNNKPVIQFDGSNDWMDIPYNPNYTAVPEMTIMMVYRPLRLTGANQGLYGQDNNGWDRLQVLNYPGIDYGIAANNGQVRVYGLDTISKPVIYTAVLRNGVANASMVYVNGRCDSTTGRIAFTEGHNNTGLNNLTIAGIAPNSLPANIQIAEVMIFDKALGAERATYEEALAQKWLGTTLKTIETPTQTTAFPTNAVIEIASGAMLDMSGGTNTFAFAGGQGTITNGALVYNAVSLGLNATRRVQVTGAGSSLTFNGTTLHAEVGSQALFSAPTIVFGSGVTLNLVNEGSLDRGVRYPLFITDSLTGTYTMAPIGTRWKVRQTGNVYELFYNGGTLITFQ
jgi:hypothetical protein